MRIAAKHTRVPAIVHSETANAGGAPYTEKNIPASRLLAEGEFPGGSLNVDVQANVVTLRGSVATAAEKAKAEEIAKTTDGVKSVRNQLVVKPGS